MPARETKGRFDVLRDGRQIEPAKRLRWATPNLVNDILADQSRTPSGGRIIPDLVENHGPGRHRT